MAFNKPVANPATNAAPAAEQKGKKPRNLKAGGVRLAIWNNVSKEYGKPYNTYTLDRSYKGKDGGWETTTSLRLADLSKAILLLQKAYEEGVLKEDAE